MWIVYILTEKGWSEDERFDTEEKAIAYKEEWLEEHPSINENQFKIEPFKTHVWLDDDTGVTVEDNQKDNFEALIGDLNDTLEEMYGCRICYDIADKDSQHFSGKKISKGKTLFDGFAIFVVEDEEKMEDA